VVSGLTCCKRVSSALNQLLSQRLNLLFGQERIQQPPLPALVRRGHAKSKPGQAGVAQSAVPSLADSLPPAPEEPASGKLS